MGYSQSLNDQLQAADYYWATETDEEALIGFLWAHFRHYFHCLRNSLLYQRIRRNYRYYHSLFFQSQDESRAVATLGEKGELAGLGVNHHRSIIEQLVNLVTQNRPAWKTKAVNSDLKSIEQARLGNQLMDYYMVEKRVEDVYLQAAEDGFVFTAGYVLTEWDPAEGREMAADPELAELYYQGDLTWSSPNFFDVAFDPRQREWKRRHWILIREWENRWDLIARNPDLADKIKGYSPEMHDDDFFIATGDEREDWDSDLVPTLKFYHRATDAMPFGRYVKIVGDSAILLDTDIPYRELPVDRFVPAHFLGTAHGYTPGFELQGIQEALNTEFSSVLTNHEQFGVQSIWTPPGANLDVDELTKGLLQVECETKPEGLNLTSTPNEITSFIPILTQHAEYVTHVNSVSRGQPEASLKSGRALALIDAKAIQSVQRAQKNWYSMLEDNASKALTILRDFASTERIVTIAGTFNRPHMKFFTGDDLSRVDRVQVEAGNALMATLAGRMEILTLLMDHGLLRTKEEVVNILNGAPIEVLMEYDINQLSGVREENETMLQGMPHRAMATDNHVLHIREHAARASSPEARMNPEVAAPYLSAVLEHLQLMLDPGQQIIQAHLANQIPMPGLSSPMQGGGMQAPNREGPGEDGRPPGSEQQSPEAEAAGRPFLSHSAAA